VGQVVGAELEFAFQRDRDHDASGFKPVNFTAVLDAGEPVRVAGTFNSARTATSSATGSRRAYLIGTVTDLAERIELRPVFIGISAQDHPAPASRALPVRDDGCEHRRSGSELRGITTEGILET
jgi:hypothetical protein